MSVWRVTGRATVWRRPGTRIEDDIELMRAKAERVELDLEFTRTVGVL